MLLFKHVRVNGGSKSSSKCHSFAMLLYKGESVAACYDQAKSVSTKASMVARLEPNQTLMEGLLGVKALFL